MNLSMSNEDKIGIDLHRDGSDAVIDEMKEKQVASLLTSTGSITADSPSSSGKDKAVLDDSQSLPRAGKSNETDGDKSDEIEEDVPMTFPQRVSNPEIEAAARNRRNERTQGRKKRNVMEWSGGGLVVCVICRKGGTAHKSL